MAKTARPRASSFFDASAMRRLTVFFGGSSLDLKGREETQTPPPPVPPMMANQRNDNASLAPTNGISNHGEFTATAPGLSLSVPSPNAMVIPPRAQSLTPPLDGTIPRPPGAGSLSSSYLRPQSPHTSSSAASARASTRNFSGTSALSAASHTSYASSRPDSPLSRVPVPPSPMVAEMPKQFRRQQPRNGGIFGRKRKDDVEIPAAWRLTHASSESLEGYNFGPLVQGDLVPDLWEPNGDTLVYLAPKGATNTKFTAPSFRISSSPLLFSALSQYIEDLQFSGSQQARPGSSLANGKLYLEVPTGSHSGVVPSISLDQDIAGPESAPISEPANSADLSGVQDQLDQRGEINEDENLAYKLYYPVLDLNPKTTAPTKGKKHKHSNSNASDDSLQHLVDARNLFAFLSYTFLVSTLHRETPFQIMEKIYKQLQGPISPQLHPEDHSPMDMNVSRRISTAESHFLYFVDELKIDDIRNDDDAIVEALIMGERWKCQRLYREGFVHACGRWDDIKDHPGCAYVSQVTKSRLDRASIDLHQIRLQNVTTRLTSFDYPSVWVGDGRYPEFKPWKAGFDAMRKFTLSYYKNVYGSWPPKAGKHGKGGGFTETGGLNRMVLRRVYEDFCAIYDLLVDREWIHGDRIRFEANYSSEGEEGMEQRSKEEHARTTMRKIMSDFDQSYVPVQPGIPFDQPRLPYIPPTPPTTADGLKKKKKKSSKPRSQKKLKSDELAAVLVSSYNSDALNPQYPNQFVAAYEKLEHDFGSGRNLDDIVEARRGRWVFMYCVLQSLPMTVVDAVGCQYSDGVEYFLCENVKGSLPWERSQSAKASRLSGIWGVTGQSPYGNLGVAGVSTSNLAGEDEIDYTYRRSHCWDIAEDWRMVRGTAIPEEDDFDLDGESGGEEFIEYQPLDNPLTELPVRGSSKNPFGLSPIPPLGHSYPVSERSQTQSPDEYEGEYVAYHQQSPPQPQSEGSNYSDPQEAQHEGYHPGTYHPGAYPESDHRHSYRSQQSLQESIKAQNLPTFEFQHKLVEVDLWNSPVPEEIEISTDSPRTDTASVSIKEQLDLAFSTDSPHADIASVSIREQLDLAFSSPPTGSGHNVSVMRATDDSNRLG